MINIPPASFRVTPYGEVDSVALENLRDGFDTSQLLRLVDRLDTCLAELGGITAMRDELLRLHAMTLTLVEGAVPTVPAENIRIWEVAQSLELDLEALVSWARSAQLLIAPLISLAPNHET
jgi:hypothetical protein